MSVELSSKITKISSNKNTGDFLDAILKNVNLGDNGNVTGLQNPFKSKDEVDSFWKDIILEFSKEKQYTIDVCWSNFYNNGDEQGWHTHNASNDDSKFTAIFYIKFDPALHQPTYFATDRTGSDEYIPVDVKQGDCLIFPSNLYHRSPINTSFDLRAVCVLNFYLK